MELLAALSIFYYGNRFTIPNGKYLCLYFGYRRKFHSLLCELISHTPVLFVGTSERLNTPRWHGCT